MTTSLMTAQAISLYIDSYENGTQLAPTNSIEANLYAQINQARATMTEVQFEDYIYDLDLTYNSFE